jgi:HPt (histidine-containing phosphotransfer) domain-containing protein
MSPHRSIQLRRQTFNRDALLTLVGGFMNADGPTEEDTLESAVIEELATFGEDYLAQLVDQFIQETNSLLLELRAARENGDYAAVGRNAHSIKGSSSQIGGRRLARSCNELEEKATSEGVLLLADDLHDVENSYEQLRRALTRRSRSGGG